MLFEHTLPVYILSLILMQQRMEEFGFWGGLFNLGFHYNIWNISIPYNVVSVREKF